MYSKKILVAAAALAVLSAGGLGSASAAPWNHDRDHRMDHRGFDRHLRNAHRHYVARNHVLDVLRLHRYRMLGDPYFVRGHYVVRSHDRFGRTVFVEVDPYSGVFLGEFRL